MTRKNLTLLLLGIALLALWGGLESAGQFHFSLVGAVEADEQPYDTELLTRGPIHEAFAQPVPLQREETFRINRQPPAPIEEIAPDEKPEGKHVVWIPGYWSWDDDRSDFIWISGCWRAVPPNCSWVPGYWRQVDGQYEWVSGFWTPAKTTEIEYLPAPPDTLEVGPPVAAPSVEMVWVSGCWVWQPGTFWRHGRYAWRPGFWMPARTNWVWIPAHYVYTPQGCVFVDGYWDRTLERRGVAFLPVYCPPRVYATVGFQFSPHIALDITVLTSNLFCWPRRHHYYFGDYYAVEYGHRGIYPWFEARAHRDCYDPIYVHQQWRHRDEPRWHDDLRRDYDRRRDDRDARPAHTYRAMETQIAHMPDKDRHEVQVARPLKDVIAERAKTVKFEKVDKQSRQQTTDTNKKVRAYKEQRAKWEAPPQVTNKVTSDKQTRKTQEVTQKSPRDLKASEPVRVKAPESPPPGKDEKVRVITAEPVRRDKDIKVPEKAVEPVAKEKDRTVKVKTAEPVARDKEAAPREEIKAHKIKTPKSPIVATETRSRDKDASPPPKPKTPKIDTKAQPRSSRDSGSDSHR
jgi:hypothetical protein